VFCKEAAEQNVPFIPCGIFTPHLGHLLTPPPERCWRRFSLCNVENSTYRCHVFLSLSLPTCRPSYLCTLGVFPSLTDIMRFWLRSKNSLPKYISRLVVPRRGVMHFGASLNLWGWITFSGFFCLLSHVCPGTLLVILEEWVRPVLEISF